MNDMSKQEHIQHRPAAAAPGDGKQVAGRAKIHSGRKMMVCLSLATALLLPNVESAHAQLAVNCTRNLNFSTIAVCGGGGTLRVQPDGDISEINCMIALGAPVAGACEADGFTTNGTLQLKVTSTLTDITGAGTMEVNNFKLVTDAGGPTVTYTPVTLTVTSIKFGIGADLEASGGQTTGSYDGQLMLRVTFTP